MNKKIQLTILSILALVGFFTSVNTTLAGRTPVVTCNSATIYGTVWPNGSTVNAWLEWGNSRTTVQNGGGARVGYQSNINSNTEISANLTGLTENTTYYYRMAVQDGSNYIPATTESFTTSTCAVSTYTVSTNVTSGNGSFSPSERPVTSGDTTSFTLIPGSGYSIGSASGCGGYLSGSTYYTRNITSACTVSGNFAPTPVDATGYLTISPSSCIILLNQSTCTVRGASWTTNNATSVSLVDKNTGNVLSNSMNQYYPITVWVAYPQTIFDLKNGTSILDTKTATASCASGSSWNGSMCTSNTLAPTVTLTADDTNLNYNSSTTLRWSTTNNPTSCTANGGWSGSKSVNGGSQSTGALNNTTTYSINCSNSAGSDSDSVTVIVNGQLIPTGNLTVSPSTCTIPLNQSTCTVRGASWTTDNATSVSLVDRNTGSTLSNSLNQYTAITVWVAYPQTIFDLKSGTSLLDTKTATASCASGSSWNGSMCTPDVVYEQNPTVSIYADNSNLDYDESTIVHWSSSYADTCYAYNGSNSWSGNKNMSGSFNTGKLYSTTTYKITCTNNVGSDTDSVTVYVDNQNNSQVSVNISADRTYVNYNESTIIRWYPVNATSCLASGGSMNWAGNRSVLASSFNTGPLTQTTTYTVSCSNYNGNSDTESVTVIIGQSPVVNNQPTVGISAASSSVSYNGTNYIRWDTTNATSCYASDGSIGWAGTKSIGPASFYTGSLTYSTTYTITCTNNFGSATASVPVTVRPQVITSTYTKPAPTSLVLITSSVDRNQPIVPTIDNTRPKPGDEINYTVNYQNIGTGAIKSLTLRMDLPYEVDYMFSTPNNPIRSGNTLIFNLGTLKANGEGTVTVRVRVRDNIPAGTNLNFPAILSYVDPSGFPQSVNANVSAQVWNETTPVVAPVDTKVQLGALAFLFGGSFLPNTLIGWLLLILVITLLVLAGRKAYYGSNITTITKKTTTNS